MDIGFLRNTYPERRCIIEKISYDSMKKYGIRYKKLSRIFEPEYVTNRLVKKKLIKRTNWDSALYYNPILKPRVDLIHTFNDVCNVRCPWITTFESTVPRTNYTVNRPWESIQDCECISKRTIRELELLAGDKCKTLIALSKSAYAIQKNMLINIAPSYQDDLMKKTYILHPPQVELITEDEIYEKFEKSNCLNFVLVGGDFFRKGGGAQIVDCMEKLHHDFCFNLTVVSSLDFGDYASYTTERDYEKYSRKLQEYDWITWYKSLPNFEVLSLLRKSHIGLLPSLADTYGYAVLELQAAGNPVLTTNIRALSEINNEDCGWVVSLKKDNIGGEAILYTEEDVEKRKMELSIGIERKLVEILSMERPMLAQKGIKSLRRIRLEHSPESYEKCLLKIYME